jgi:MFS family permease
MSGIMALPVPAIVMGWPRGDATGARWQPFARGIRMVVRERLILATSLAQSAQFMLNGALTAFLPLYARETLGLSASQIGWLFGLQTITTLATRPAIGIVSDRIGRRGVIVVGLLLCGSGVLLVSFARSVEDLLIGVCGYAVGAAATTGAASAYITDLTHRSSYGAAHGVFGTIYDVGDAAGPLLGGVLVALLGYERTFQIMAATVLVAALSFALVRTSAGAEVPAPPSARPPGRR